MSIDAGRRALNDQVAEEIRVQLARKRMSQAELARRMAVSGPWLSYRLTGKQPIDLNDLAAIAKALGVDVSALLPESPERAVSINQLPQVSDVHPVKPARVRPPTRADAVTRPPNRPVGPRRPALLRGNPSG